MKKIDVKRIVAILCMLVVVFTLSAPCASAAGLGITKTSPAANDKGVPLENMSVKIFFDQDVYNKDNFEANRKAFKLVDEKGHEVPTRVLFNAKYKDVALVLAEKHDAKGNLIKIEPVTKYTLYIDDDFVAANGDKLAKSEKVSFETLNPTTTMKISMGMMVIMMVAMVFASSKAMKKQQEKEEKENHSKKEEKFNPYKVAKETGKSVEEVLAIEKKRKEREAAKEERKEERKAKLHKHDNEIEEDDEIEEYMAPGHYKVKRARTVAEAGSTYVTGKKAEAERKAEIAAKVKAEKKAGTYGKKGKKRK